MVFKGFGLGGPVVIFINIVLFCFFMRIHFKRGGQRKFLDLVVEKLRSPSLRGILQFGFDVSYSTLKNYYIEDRLLPKDFFDDLCEIADVDKSSLSFESVDDNWGRRKGGQVSKRKS